MVFKKMVKFKVDGIPSKLGHYVVDKLNTKSMVMDFENEIIRIDKEAIHRPLRLSMGGKDVSYELKKQVSSVYANWRKLYERGDIGQSIVRYKIKNEKYERDVYFKMDFLLLFCSVMIDITNNGTYKFKFFKYFNMETDLNKYDWCGFIIQGH